MCEDHFKRTDYRRQISPFQCKKALRSDAIPGDWLHIIPRLTSDQGSSGTPESYIEEVFIKQEETTEDVSVPVEFQDMQFKSEPLTLDDRTTNFDDEESSNMKTMQRTAIMSILQKIEDSDDDSSTLPGSPHGCKTVSDSEIYT